MKYNVECLKANNEMFIGEEPINEIYYDVFNDYVEAKNEEEAIILAMTHIQEVLVNEINVDKGYGKVLIDIKVNFEKHEIVYTYESDEGIKTNESDYNFKVFN